MDKRNDLRKNLPMRRQPTLFLLLAVSQAVGLVSFAENDSSLRQSGRQSPPLGPDNARAAFRLPDDLTIELVACEPDVVDPVAVAWDEDGRMFVVEMGDYPTGPPGGRIKLLDDRDGDGRVDSSRVFADKLPFPTSVLPWRGGVFVSAAPDILYLKDTDGDGMADQRTVMFTGFGEGNQQLRVNGLVFGIDNWVYAANGRSDGDIHPVPPLGQMPLPIGHKGLSIRQRDLRFRPDDGRFEATSSFTQHGHGFDDWGHRFIGWNTTHIRHVVMEQRYLERSPHVPAMSAVEEISDHGSAARIFPASKTTQRFNAEPPGFFNASCGLTVCRGDLLPPAYRGNAFVCEPLSNIVHRDVLEPAAATFVARRGEGEHDREFLASTDPWFRPVNLATGPDGALYVVDFYRAWVEHPGYVRDETAKKTVDWREGADRGRIWRLVPKGSKPRPSPKLGQLKNDELVRLLEHPNGWHRDTAQRLLVQRRVREVAPALIEIIVRSETPSARVHALRTLDGLGALDDATLFQVLGDPHPRVRENAVQLAEPRLAGSRKLTGLVADLADDPDARVRFQVACSLGSGLTPVEVRATVLRIARRDFADRWIRRAVLGAMAREPQRYLKEFLTEASNAEEPATGDDLEFVHDLAAMVGATPMEADKVEAFAVLEKLPGPHARTWSLAGVTGLADGVRLSGRSLNAWQETQAVELQRAREKILQRWFPVAGELTRSSETPAVVRTMAARLLGHAPFDIAGPALGSLIGQKCDSSLQLAAVRSLAAQTDPRVVESLLADWASATPSVRAAVLDAMLSRRDRVPQVVAALESGKLSVADLGPVHSETLLRLADECTRPRVQKVLGERSSSDRAKVLASFEPALILSGDRSKGTAVFAKHCMTCHAIQGTGHRVGPDLASVAARPREQNLADILDPNRSVSTDSVSYVIATRNGRVLSGVIAAETGTAITLRRAEGIEESIARSEIEELRSTGKSLMPEGLEQGITQQDMADLLEFLRTGEPPAKGAK